MRFHHLIQPETVEEALEWAKKPNAVILGGAMWLHLQNRTVEHAVDLSRLGLDKIEETEDGIRIGAYVTLRQLETNPLFTKYSCGANKTALSPIVGVQFRNTATVGGSVFGRFGFSDVTTLFSALGTSVCLAGAGTIPTEQFVRDGAPRDVLTHILLPKEAPDGAAAQSQRNTATDFPVLTTAVCRRGEKVRVSLSPAPLRCHSADFSVDELPRIPDKIADSIAFRADRAASAEYRKHLCRVLLKRALASMGGSEDGTEI